MPVTGTWGGQPIWEAAKVTPVKVGKYGTATAKIELVPRRCSMTNIGYKYAKLEMPIGGLNQWSSEELRQFAALLLVVADDLDTHPLGYMTDR